MSVLALAFTLTLLGINVWGLALIAGLYWRDRWFALAAGPLLAVTLFFAIECHFGMGPTLQILAVISTPSAIALIIFSLTHGEPNFLSPKAKKLVMEWREEFAIKRITPCIIVGSFIFLYGLSWRYIHPDIDGSSEKIADFSYIASYYSGEKIPVSDAWYHPFLSVHYYSFQHYGAALMGRILGLPAGTSYNLGLSFLIGMCGVGFAGTVFHLARKPWVRALLILGFVIGGTGMSIFIHLTDKDVQPWSSMRFIGSAQMDKPPIGPIFKEYNMRYFVRDPEGVPHPMDLPGEIFSYVLYLGDYHAPLSGYYLMGLLGMAIILWHRTRLRRYAVFAGATLTWALLANTWIVPMQGIVILAFVSVNWRDVRELIPSIAAGAAAIFLASWVYLSAFISSAAGYGVHLKLVPWAERTPPLLFLLFMLPTIGLILLGFCSGTRQGRILGAFWLFCLLFSEFVFVKDIYAGHYERFNTTLKWWPWVTAGTLMTLGPCVLEMASRRWVRVVGFCFCLYPCFYVIDLWRPMGELLAGPKLSMGQLEGTYFLTKDEFPRLMLQRLKVEKKGVVVERPEEMGGFTNSSVIPLFAGQKMWLGWFGHELLWRGFPEDIRRRHDLLMKLYAGDIPEAGRWLQSQEIDYVLWYRPGDTPELWSKIDKSVSPQYSWCEILAYDDGRKVGFWRRDPSLRP